VILETELWPVLFRTVVGAGCELLIVNGRISDAAWPRYRRWRVLFREVLALPRIIAAQTEVDRQRFIELGAPAGNVVVAGNLKYDAAPAAAAPPAAIQELITRAQPGHVWIAASTTAPVESGDPDEDDAVIAAFGELAHDFPRLLLILVPRKPERFETAAAKLADAGISYVRRSTLEAGDNLPLPGVLLLDTLGELNSIFAVADVVFMGGSLAQRGGHNILEPAAAGKAVIAGPHMENFAAIAEEFRKSGALVEVGGPAGLAAAVRNLLSDPASRTAVGARARELAESKRGATARAVRTIVAARDLAIPQFQGPGPAWPLLWVLALVWRAGNRWKERRDFRRARSLRRPVISVGGIGMGGAGKTPVALFLARRLASSGLRPAILTRGYGRRAASRVVIVPAGGEVSVDQTGDEAQIFVRDGLADVGIAADRHEAGRMLEELTAPGVFILDDGFQHRRLKRDFDLVLIDALDPFAGGDLFPAGRLREPLRALARADAFLITRAEPGRPYRGILQILARYNPRAPVFHSRAVSTGWIEHATGFPAQPDPRAAIAFCGIGNPHSFWQTLDDLGIEPRLAWAFGDHHTYTTREMQRLGAEAKALGARFLLTTRKDSFNLPWNAAELAAPARILCLDIDAQVFEEEEFIRTIRDRCNI